MNKKAQTIIAVLLFMLLMNPVTISQDLTIENVINQFPNGMEGGNPPTPEAMTQRFINGLNAGDNYGYSVSNAGDVNGDGYDDIIVGAYGNDAGGSGAGRAYIYFGGSIWDNTADLILTGEAAGDAFGNSVSTAGDVNGDGYSDVIVGAYGNDSGGSLAGRAYIYFGGSTMDNTADVIMTGEAAGDYFSQSVHTAGDVNGDGYSDVIVGAYWNDAGGAYAGAAYIYFGGSTMNNTADVLITGEAAGDEFGYSVSTAGDVNGDGYSDVIVGAFSNGAGGTNSGRAYIYFGGSGMDNTADIIMTGEAVSNSFGNSVCTAGDVNGDGYSDVIIGAYANDAAGINSGRAYIYLGGASMDNTADVVMTGEAAGDYFSQSVHSAGDVNGDGYSDVIIGAIANDASASNAGRAYVYFGGNAMDNIVDVVITGESADDYLGISVCTAGDVNSDGYSDIIIGAHGNDAAGTDAGKAYIYFNSLTGWDIPDYTFSDSYYGYAHSLSSAGDVNGDGYKDLIIGTYFYSNDYGRAYIYYGGTIMDNSTDLTLFGNYYDYKFGASVSDVGDVNGDGYDDIIVGVPEYYYGSYYVGRACIYYGGASMNSGIDVSLTGEAGYNFFGESVSGAGDMNGDGYTDVIVGARNNSADGGGAGRAYIYFGGSYMDNLADVTFSPGAAGYQLGTSVSGVGDINGDGLDDVVVGAPDYDTSSGAAFIYLGDTYSISTTPYITFYGENSNDNFGQFVSSAGDVNGDGYMDVIVNAPNFNSNAGKVYIYYGGIAMDNVADITIEGYETNSYFGHNVTSAGDVNKDGYSDIIAGEDKYTGGKTYIYFGGYSMDIIPDIYLTSTGAKYGKSVSGVGDMNNDGYDDVLVGKGYSSDGDAYLYLSSSPAIIPRIMSVKDVPNDQGGYVHLKWVRSGYDVQGISKITEYLVQRSLPPAIGGYAWETIATVTATNEPFYSYTASTLYDSTTNSSGTFYFRVTARTSDPNEYWRSNIVSGHSVDNLAPVAPLSFYANLSGNNVHLGWQANTEGDLREYYIYRDVNPLAMNLTLIGVTTDTTYTDTTLSGGNVYYYLSAVDIHNNESSYSQDSITALISANIRVYLEGPYVGGQMSTFLNASGYVPLSQPYNVSPWNYSGTESVSSVPANVVDWVLLELRSDLTTISDRRAAFLKNDGSLVELDGVSNIRFPNVTTGDYYVVINHRNHLSVMTAQKVTVNFSPVLYDMRTDINKTYGSNPMKNLGGGYYGMIAGDIDADGNVDYASDLLVYWVPKFGLDGYYSEDINLNGTVDYYADLMIYWVPNFGLSTQVPAVILGANPVTEPIATKKIKGK